VNTVAASSNNIMEQMTEMSRRKKPRRWVLKETMLHPETSTSIASMGWQRMY